MVMDVGRKYICLYYNNVFNCIKMGLCLIASKNVCKPYLFIVYVNLV